MRAKMNQMEKTHKEVMEQLQVIALLFLFAELYRTQE